MDPGTGALTVSGGGDMWRDMKAGPWIIFEDEVRSVFLPETLGDLFPNAFAGCGGIRTAGPSGGGYDLEFAWSGTIPANAFSGMAGLESVVLPDKLLKLSDGAFNGCSSLKALRIPEYVESIGANVISGCVSLDSLGPYGSGCAIEIPWKEPCLEALLRNNPNIRSVSFPDGISEITDRLCSGCSGLETAVIPATVKTIGYGAFSGCSGLGSVTIPGAVTKIGESAFSGCSGLKELHLPHCLVSVGRNAFSGCAGLESVTLPGCVEALDGVFANCASLKEVRISNGAVSIGYGAFSGCTSLETLYLPRSVRTIGENAFLDCEKLTDVRFTGSAGDLAGVRIAGGNGTLTDADFTYAENPVGEARADVVSVSVSKHSGVREVSASVHCALDAEVTAIAALYGRDGRFLGSAALKLQPGQDNQLTIPVGDAYTVRIFSVSGADGAPVTPTANAAVG